MNKLVVVFLVVALLGAAAVLATPPGRLPLALRGIRRVLRRDAESNGPQDESVRAPAWRRLLAFALVVAAALLAML